MKDFNYKKGNDFEKIFSPVVKDVFNPSCARFSY